MNINYFYFGSIFLISLLIMMYLGVHFYIEKISEKYMPDENEDTEKNTLADKDIYPGAIMTLLKIGSDKESLISKVISIHYFVSEPRSWNECKLLCNERFYFLFLEMDKTKQRFNFRVSLKSILLNEIGLNDSSLKVDLSIRNEIKYKNATFKLKDFGEGFFYEYAIEKNKQNIVYWEYENIDSRLTILIRKKIDSKIDVFLVENIQSDQIIINSI